jgi:hypothetical protein
MSQTPSQSPKDVDRQAVLSDVYDSIQKRITPDTVAVYVKSAREYGKKYGIGQAVEDWIQEGRNYHSNAQSATNWANELP